MLPQFRVLCVAGGSPTTIIAATPFARMNTHEEASLVGLNLDKMQVSACGRFPHELSWGINVCLDGKGRAAAVIDFLASFSLAY